MIRPSATLKPLTYLLTKDKEERQTVGRGTAPLWVALRQKHKMQYPVYRSALGKKKAIAVQLVIHRYRIIRSMSIWIKNDYWNLNTKYIDGSRLIDSLNTVTSYSKRMRRERNDETYILIILLDDIGIDIFQCYTVRMYRPPMMSMATAKMCMGRWMHTR